jgi:paired amphipathic helix protein Sin3a
VSSNYYEESDSVPQQEWTMESAVKTDLSNAVVAPTINSGMRELRVEDALLYLDDVKREFKDRPRIYNEFLGIMKNFKSQTVDTPGVIARVSKLFRGYNNLILGFNTFLPDGFKISLADLQRNEAEERAAEEGKKKVPLKKPAPLLPSPAPVMRKKAPKPADHRPAAATAAQSSPPAAAHQAVEFDHAISYVTTIKRRFANDPQTYHSFLEILHNYQKEQRGIKEVLEQVAHLFQDHADLLKEFTFFLPDAVQEQAKERLHRAAADSEARQAAAAAAAALPPLQRPSLDATRSTTAPGRGRAVTMDRKRVPTAATTTPSLPLVISPPAEAVVYNAAVERQFFDTAREAISYARDGGQAWAELCKCLDMYAQEVLSKTEMLCLVEPLLGKRNAKLFDEFKRLLAAAALPTTEDAWYSVPLSEIDFSRCRQCSPSYRALPRDYPTPPCSDRGPDECAVLNDVWVSLPVGSEESYTFRHMRRNMYEETLFRCEDERFEIDMAVEANASTLHRLLPICEEICALAREEMDTDGGLGGKRFQYTLDPTILSVHHCNSIRRIYGDAGEEMLELVFKNPSVAVPLVVQRLRQKDQEWHAVRNRMNRPWKDLTEVNYYKSLDHRSLTWRTTDKRATSARTLVAEIKDRALNGGHESKEAIRLKLDKAKEEHGTFYEVTMAHELARNVDLTSFPPPDARLFTPHLAVTYENSSWVQRDAFRILTFALERGSISPGDKERCHRLWVEFLGPWFGLSRSWMQRPAALAQEYLTATASTAHETQTSLVSEDEDGMDEDEPKDTGKGEVPGLAHSDHHPLPCGATVSTLFGDGKVIGFRRDDQIYVVKLGFGATGYVRPQAVLCSVLAAEKSALTRQLRSEDPTRLARLEDQLLIGPQSVYVFFRLHQIFIRRLNLAKELAFSVGSDSTLQSMVEQIEDENPVRAGRCRYDAYLTLLYTLLDGGGPGSASEGGKYEDRVRGLLGHGAFELATMDKLITHIWKNLQSMAQDDSVWSLVQIYRRHLDAGNFRPEAFRQEAAHLSEGEPMYAFQHCPVPGKDQSVLYMEHLGVIDEDSDADDQDTAPGEAVPPTKLDEPVNKRPKRT